MPWVAKASMASAAWGLRRSGGWRVDRGVGGLRVESRQGARLVYHHGVHLSDFLQSRGVLYEDIFLGGFANADHEGCGSGEPHGTRTCNDQHRHGRDNSLRQMVATADDSHSRKVSRLSPMTVGTKMSATLVDKTLNGSLRALCLFHHAYNVSQYGRLSYLLGTKAERIACAAARRWLGDGASQHAVALLLGHGGRLAGNHRLVDVGYKIVHQLPEVGRSSSRCRQQESFSPGRTSIVSPRWRVAMGASEMVPFSTKWAVLGLKPH